jgi:hypothetical protein
MPKLLLCSLIVVALAQLASADSTGSLIPPPAIGTIDVFSSCPPAICTSGFGVDTPASGYADFNPAGTQVIFIFTTDNPITWGFDQSGNYFANFGYGGSFDMDGPGGLTFTGVITSGEAMTFCTSSNVSVDFFGQWSNGQYADGSADVQQTPLQTSASLDEQIAPEPSSFLLLGTGIVGLWGWGRKLMQ